MEPPVSEIYFGKVNVIAIIMWTSISVPNDTLNAVLHGNYFGIFSSQYPILAYKSRMKIPEAVVGQSYNKSGY